MSADSPSSIGDRLRFLRNERGITQDDVARAIEAKTGKHTDKASVSNWERDKNLPSRDIVRAYGEVLGAVDEVVALVVGAPAPNEWVMVGYGHEFTPAKVIALIEQRVKDATEPLRAEMDAAHESLQKLTQRVAALQRDVARGSRSRQPGS